MTAKPRAPKVSTVADGALVELPVQDGLVPDPSSFRFNQEGVEYRLMVSPHGSYFLHVLAAEDRSGRPLHLSYHLKRELTPPALPLPGREESAEIAFELHAKSKALIEQISALDLAPVEKGRFLADYIRAHGLYVKDRPEMMAFVESGNALQQFKNQEAVFWQEPGRQNWGMKCDHYAKFYVALARKLGLPARIRAGYLNGADSYLLGDDRHAWPQVWDEEKKTWADVEPTAARRPGAAPSLAAQEQERYLAAAARHTEANKLLEKLEVRLDQIGHPLLSAYLFCDQALPFRAAWRAAYRKAAAEAEALYAGGDTHALTALENAQAVSRQTIERTLAEAAASGAGDHGFLGVRLQLTLGMLETMLKEQPNHLEAPWHREILGCYSAALKKFGAAEELGFTIAEDDSRCVFITRDGKVFRRNLGEFAFERLPIDLSGYGKLSCGAINRRGDLVFAAERGGHWEVLKNEKRLFELAECPHDLKITAGGDVYATYPKDKMTCAVSLNGREIGTGYSIELILSEGGEHAAVCIKNDGSAVLYKDGRSQSVPEQGPIFLFKDGSWGGDFKQGFYLNGRQLYGDVNFAMRAPPEKGSATNDEILLLRSDSTFERYEVRGGSLRLLEREYADGVSSDERGGFVLREKGVVKSRFLEVHSSLGTRMGHAVTGKNMSGEKVLYSNGIETRVPEGFSASLVSGSGHFVLTRDEGREVRVFSARTHKELYRGELPPGGGYQQPLVCGESLLVFRPATVGGMAGFEPILVDEQEAGAVRMPDGRPLVLEPTLNIEALHEHLLTEPKQTQGVNGKDSCIASAGAFASNRWLCLETDNPNTHPLSLYRIDVKRRMAALVEYRDPESGTVVKFDKINYNCSSNFGGNGADATGELAFIGRAGDRRYVVSGSKIVALNERAPGEQLDFTEGRGHFILNDDQHTALDGVRLGGFAFETYLSAFRLDEEGEGPYTTYLSKEGRLCLMRHDLPQELKDLGLKMVVPAEEFSASVRALGADGSYSSAELMFAAQNYLYHAAGSESFAARQRSLMQDIMAPALERLPEFPMSDAAKVEMLCIALEGRMRGRSELTDELAAWADEAGRGLGSCRRLLFDKLAGIVRSEDGSIVSISTAMGAAGNAAQPWRTELAGLLNPLREKSY